MLAEFSNRPDLWVLDMSRKDIIPALIRHWCGWLEGRIHREGLEAVVQLQFSSERRSRLTTRPSQFGLPGRGSLKR